MRSKIEIKLFVGFHLTPDLMYELKNNAAWKLSQIAISTEDLIEIKEKGKEYIGVYLKENKTTYHFLMEKEKKLKLMLHHYLPMIDTHDLHLEILSKLFVL